MAPSVTFCPMVSATWDHGILTELELHTDWIVRRSCSSRSAVVVLARLGGCDAVLTIPAHKHASLGSLAGRLGSGAHFVGCAMVGYVDGQAACW